MTTQAKVSIRPLGNLLVIRLTKEKPQRGTAITIEGEDVLIVSEDVQKWEQPA